MRRRDVDHLPMLRCRLLRGSEMREEKRHASSLLALFQASRLSGAVLAARDSPDPQTFDCHYLCAYTICVRTCGKCLCFYCPSACSGDACMRVRDKTEEQLINELTEMRRKVAELETTAAKLRETEKALRESEAKYKAIFLRASEGILVADASTAEFKYANPAICKMLGYTEDELVGLSISDIHPKDKLDYVASEFQAVAAGEKSRSANIPCLRKDGTVFLANIGGASVTIDGLPCAVGFFSDITERQKGEEALARANEDWQRTFEAISDRIMVLDSEHRILRANKATANAFGMTESELIGKSCFELMHGTEGPPAFCPHSQLLADGEEHRAEVVEPGLGATLDVRVSPIFGQNRKVIGSVHVTRDITERKRAEEALRKSEEQYRLLVDLAPDAIVISRDGRIIYLNKAAMQLLNETDPGQVVGTYPIEWVHPDDQALVKQRMQVLLASETLVPPATWRLLRRDGAVRDVEAVSGSLRSGKSIIIHAMLRDITDRKRTENIMLARVRLMEYAASHSLDQLLQAVLDEVEALTDSSIGFYHFVDADQKTLRLQAWSTRTSLNCATRGKGLHYDIDQAGVWVDCVHEGKPVIHNDYAALPHRKGMPAGHANVVRELVVPVFRNERIVAILGVGNKPAGYDASDIETVSLLADLAWDITERKVAEEALRAASLYNRSLIEASLDPLVTISAYGKITDVNRATERVTGYSRNELIGTDFADYFTDSQKARDGYQRAFTEGAVTDYELEIRHRDGSLTSVMYNASVYHDASGQIVGLFAAARDISRSKQAEEKNLWLAAIVESSDDAIIGKNLDGIITSWNKGAAKIYGYRDTDVLGKPISLLVPPDRQDEVSQLLKRIKLGEHVEHYETVRRKKDGREIDVSLTVSPVRNAQGEVVGASTTARDVTEQKSLQRQLLQAQKMEALGTLAGGIAHDFNNLLTVILGYSELLLIGKDERDPSYADLQKIHQSARSGADLVQRILAFSRKTEINPRPLNLNHEIEQMKKLLGRTIPKMIEIRLLLSDELAIVNADPVQIEQILMNLAVNAKDAMPDGGKLTIETTNVALDEEYCRMHLGSKAGDYVLLTIWDTGNGMEKDILKHIFEPFYTTKGIGRGTGLGLAIVYGIVKQHDGYITCYSEPGMGTTFKIYLPVISGEAKSEIPTVKHKLPRGTESILLVDDEEYVRDLGKRILERSGYTVFSAANGKEALDLYKKERSEISLVVLDLIMPQMGGKECLEALLKIDPLVKVLIASGYAAEGQTKDTIEAGAKGFVGKPYDMKQMLQAVREVLDSDKNHDL